MTNKQIIRKHVWDPEYHDPERCQGEIRGNNIGMIDQICNEFICQGDRVPFIAAMNACHDEILAVIRCQTYKLQSGDRQVRIRSLPGAVRRPGQTAWMSRRPVACHLDSVSVLGETTSWAVSSVSRAEVVPRCRICRRTAETCPLEDRKTHIDK